MKRTLSIILALILALSAVSFTAFAVGNDAHIVPDDDLAASGLSEYPPHPEYTIYSEEGLIPGTTGGGTKADPIIVDTYEELKAALEYPVDGLYIRCDTCRNTAGLDYIAPTSPTGESGTNYVDIEVDHDKYLTLNADLDVRSSKVGYPFLYSLIDVSAYLKVDGTGRIGCTFSATNDFPNSIFYISNPGILEISGVTIEGTNKENGVTPDTYARAIYCGSGGVALINSGNYIGVSYAWDSNSSCDAVGVSSSGTAIINGGTFKSNLSKSCGLFVSKNGKAILTGGTFYGMNSQGNLPDFLKEGFVYKDTSTNTVFDADGLWETNKTLRVEYTNGFPIPVEGVTRRQASWSVGNEYITYTPPADNTWYDEDPIGYSIGNNNGSVYIGDHCYLDYAGVDSEAYDLDYGSNVMSRGAGYSFTSYYKPITIKFYLTAKKNYCFDSSSRIYINNQLADLEIINGKRAVASLPLTYTDDESVIDTIEIKGTFAPAPGSSAEDNYDKLQDIYYTEDERYFIYRGWIGESSKNDTYYTGELTAGKTYYAWLTVDCVDPNIFGVNLSWSYQDPLGQSNPSSASGNYGSEVGTGGWVKFCIPFTIPSTSGKFTVSGTVTSFLSDTDNVTVRLYQSGTFGKTIIKKGNSINYSFKDVTPGFYTLRVFKNNHVAREIGLFIAGNRTQDMTINPLGDVDLSGKVDIKDVNALYKHVMETKKLTDPYALQCSDVSKDYNTVDIKDVNALYKHVMETKLLY